MATLADNKAVSRWLVEEVINRGNMAGINKILTGHTSEFQKLITSCRAAFPDLHCTIEEEMAEGDKVAFRLTFTATHTGVWLGVPPTGRQVRWSAVFIMHYENGKIVGGGLVQDNLSLLRQLDK